MILFVVRIQIELGRETAIIMKVSELLMAIITIYTIITCISLLGAGQEKQTNHNYITCMNLTGYKCWLSLLMCIRANNKHYIE